MTNRSKIFDFLYENKNQTFSPVFLSSLLNIPNSSVRNELGNLKRFGQVEVLNNPFDVGHLDYYTNDIIIKNWVDGLKKEKRRLQCKLADKKYRAKLREQKQNE